MKRVITAFAVLLVSSNLMAQDIAGTFTMKAPTINYFTGARDKTKNSSNDTNAKTAITIDSLKIYVVEGTIRKIYVYSGVDIRFTNEQVPISITKFKNRIGDALFENDDDQKYIYLGDILSYRQEGENRLIPDDITFTLKPGATTNNKPIDKSSILAIDLRAFSDMLGVFDDQPNGLVQTEGSLKIITQTQNTIRNVPLYLVQYVQPYFGLARFDSTFKQTNILGDSTVNRMSMLQRSSFTFGVKLNILKYYAKSGGGIELNGGYQYNRTDLYRNSDSTKLGVSLNSFYLQAPIKIKFARTIGFNYTPTVYFQNPQSSKSTDYLKNLSSNTIIQNEFFFYFNVDKNDKNNKVFIRFNMFSNLTEKGNNYNQLQIGYERSLTDLLNKIAF